MARRKKSASKTQDPRPSTSSRILESRTSRLLLAALGGLAGVFAFPPWSWWWTAWLMPVFLFRAFHGAGKGMRFLAGWVFGIVYFAGAFFWIVHTLESMSGLGTALSVVGLVLFGMSHGLLVGFFGLLSRWVERTTIVPWPFVLAALLAVMEQIFIYLFPLRWGDSLITAPWLVQFVDLTSVAGATWLIAMVGGWLEELRRRRAQGTPLLTRGPLVALGIVLAVLAYDTVRWAQIGATDPTTTVETLLVQPNFRPGEKLASATKVKHSMLDRSIALTEEGLAEFPDTELIVMPEGGFPTYFQCDTCDEGTRGAKSVSKRFTDAIAAWGKPIMFGSLRRQGNRTINSAVYIAPDGTQTVYDKHLLVPFGEYMPFSDWFPSLLDALPGVSNLKPGDTLVAFETPHFVAAPSICYEAVFPTFTQSGVAAAGASVIANFTNNVWFGPEGAPAIHLLSQQSRAVELRTTLIHSTATGITSVVTPRGQLLLTTPTEEATWAHTEVPVYDLFSLYRLLGPIVIWLMALFVAASSLIGRLRRRRGDASVY